MLAPHRQQQYAAMVRVWLEQISHGRFEGARHTAARTQQFLKSFL